MKTTLYTLLLLFSFTFAQAQEKLSISHSFSISSRSVVYDKATGERIPQDLLEVLIQQPNAVFHRYFDERGGVSYFVYDASSTIENTNFYNPAERVKPGEPFPPFIMTTLVKKELSSERMRGKTIVLNFQLMMREPFLKQQRIKAFEEIISSYKALVEVVYVTSSTEAETEKALLTTTISYPIVTDAHNFREKYKIDHAVAYVVVSPEGKLVGYANTETALKQLLDRASK